MHVRRPGPGAHGVIALLVGASLLAAGSPDYAAAQVEDLRPNIVFVLTDDLDVPQMRHAPRLRQMLGDKGVTFDNSFVTNSLCCPSRATSLRGQYAHNHKILQNSAPLGGWPKFFRLGHERSTIATWLQDGGYQTFYLGKYLNNYEHTYVPPGWDEWYGWMGFYDSRRNQSDQYRINHNGEVLSFDPEQTHDTDLLAAQAGEYVREAATRPSPFFLYLSLNAPHQPAPTAVRHQDRFRDSRQPRTPAFNEADVSDKPWWVRRKPLLDASEITQVDAVYRRRLRSMLSVEDAVANLVSALEDTGQLGAIRKCCGWRSGGALLGGGQVVPFV